MDKMDNQELISALADGQLQGEAFARGVKAACADREARGTWQAYCVIGEVLRSGRATPAGTAPEVFLSRLQARLQQEPIRPQVAPVVVSVRTRGDAPANDWRWKLVAGVASVAAVAAVGWNMYGAGSMGSAQPQLASAPAPAAAIVPVAASVDPRSQPMLRDPRLDQLLQAHRQLGGATALHNPSGFLRNATFEGPAR